MALLGGCAGGRAGAPSTRVPTRTVGVYKGRVLDAAGKARRFKLLLFAELPDRIHVEVLSPLGHPQLILDCGDGRMAVTFVPEGESFVGEASSEVLGRILGARLDLGELVRIVLMGTGAPNGYRVQRSGGATPGLPDSLAIDGREAALAIELKRRRPLEVDPSGLGTGRAPPATRVRPIEELEPQEERLETLLEQEPSS